MGMFDAPKYLTGATDGFVNPGETFYIWNARMEGTVNVSGKQLPQAKLLVSRTIDGERVIVFTSGAGITSQIQRMDRNDLDAMSRGLHVRLDEVPSKQGSPTRVLTPADEAPAAQREAETAADF